MTDQAREPKAKKLVTIVAYTFVRLSQRFDHSGSVYGFVGATLGARAGAFSGWAMAGTYIFYGAVTSMAAGIFLTSEIRALGMWKQAPDWLGFLIGAVLLGLVWFLASRPANGGTRLLLIVESVTVALILIVTVVIIVKLLVGNPRKDIPRAILGTAIFGGVYFIVVTAVEVMGFGTDEKGIRPSRPPGRCSATSERPTSPRGSARSSPSERASAPSRVLSPASSVRPD